MESENEIINKLKMIHVQKGPQRKWKGPEHVIIDNPTNYELIGKGRQGVVFRIDSNRCAKVYHNRGGFEKEKHALQLGNRMGVCPEVYFWGEKFIVMEYLDAPTLQEFLQDRFMNQKLAKKLIELFDCFEKIGYTRYDFSARHVFILPEGQLKVIDLVHAFKVQPIPKRLIRDLGEHTSTFLKLVKDVSPQWYNRWIQDPDFNRLLESVSKK